MPATHRLDLPAIERALREVQSRFAELSRHFTEPRDPLTDEVLHDFLVDLFSGDQQGAGEGFGKAAGQAGEGVPIHRADAVAYLGKVFGMNGIHPSSLQSLTWSTRTSGEESSMRQ